MYSNRRFPVHHGRYRPAAPPQAHPGRGLPAMRLIPRALIFCLLLAPAGPAAVAQAPTPAPTPPPAPAKPAPARKPQSRIRAVAGKLVDTAATAAAGMATDSLLGAKGKSVANALGVGNDPCGQSAAALAGLGGVPAASAGTAVIGAAKKSFLKKKKPDSAPPAASRSEEHTSEL